MIVVLWHGHSSPPYKETYHGTSGDSPSRSNRVIVLGVYIHTRGMAKRPAEKRNETKEKRGPCNDI